MLMAISDGKFFCEYDTGKNIHDHAHVHTKHLAGSQVYDSPQAMETSMVHGGSYM